MSSTTSFDSSSTARTGPSCSTMNSRSRRDAHDHRRVDRTGRPRTARRPVDERHGRSAWLVGAVAVGSVAAPVVDDTRSSVAGGGAGRRVSGRRRAARVANVDGRPVAVGRANSGRRRRSRSPPTMATAATERPCPHSDAAAHGCPTRARPSCTTLTASARRRCRSLRRRGPRRAGRQRCLVVQQPFVGAERSVEPHRVVEAGHLHAGAFPRQAERQHRRVEQGHVARVRDDAGVQDGVVGQLAVRRAATRAAWSTGCPSC